MASTAFNWSGFLHGGDYSPEQWLDRPDIFLQDIEYFHRCHINTVTLGVFSWSLLEPEEGVFDFSWLGEILDRLYTEKISVILATPSGARPKWLADRYPEVLRVSADRRRNLFGARHNHCYTSPIYREKVATIDKRLSVEFGHHPSVIAWHISNELGGECHCPLCQQAFQSWLRDKYVTIENLNDSWQTTFWSHTYRDFSQVESPSPIGEMALHGLNLDWRRFVTEQTCSFLAHEIAVVRAYSNLPVTTNFMYNYDGLDYSKLAKLVDFISWDSYPLWHTQEDWMTASDHEFEHDMMRSFLHRPFVLMESCPSATNWQSVSRLKRPGLLATASLNAIAHGSDSVMYFQLQQSRGASEKFHGAVVGLDGEFGRVQSEISEVGTILQKIKEIQGSTTESSVVILHDRESIWAMEDAQGPRNIGLRYRDHLLSCYRALRGISGNIDVASADTDFSGYRLVVIPMLYMFRDGLCEKLEQFVHAGGYLVVTHWCGVVDENDRCWMGRTPHGLEKVLGAWRREVDALCDSQNNSGKPVLGNELGLTKNYRCGTICELLEVTVGTPVMMYADDFYADTPVVVQNHYGNGFAYYVASHFDDDFYRDFFAAIAGRAGVQSIIRSIPHEVSVTERMRANGDRYVFIQNFGPMSVPLDSGIFDDAEILLGTDSNILPGYGTLILRFQSCDRNFTT
jgi:beta-galactosidase